MITSKVNQYFGVNAHANGLLQQAKKWVPFHSRHIIDLTDAITPALPEGYFVVPEASLQIEFTDEDTDQRQRPRPDASIYDPGFRPLMGFPSGPGSAGLLVPTTQLMRFDLTELHAAVIYKIEDDEIFGRPVARLELLSPSNKLPSRAGTAQYEQSRLVALMSGLPLVEVDYLHRQPSVNATMPLYPDDADAKAYSITLHVPRTAIHNTMPNIEDAMSTILAFNVDERIPSIQIPLATGDITGIVHLNRAYNTSFESSPYLQRFADYSKDPVDLATYSAADQERIRRRMEIVQAKAAQGISLAEGPFSA